MNGQQVKELILSSGIRLWQVAEKLNMNDGNFSRRLRRPFDDEEIQKIKDIIYEIKQDNKQSRKTIELFKNPNTRHFNGGIDNE